MKFTRHAYHRKKRLKPRWRRPRGLHNKQRLGHKSSTPLVKVGYRSPKATRYKKNGLEIVQVYNQKDIEGLDPDTHGVVIGKIGLRKKLVLLELVEKKGLTLLTGDAKQTRNMLQQQYDEQKKAREEKRASREKQQEELKEEDEDSQEGEDAATPLSKVKGVGPSRIEKLEEAGIESAEELASMTAQQLAEKSDVSESVAKKIIDAATKATEPDENAEKEKVLTKAR